MENKNSNAGQSPASNLSTYLMPGIALLAGLLIGIGIGRSSVDSVPSAQESSTVSPKTSTAQVNGFNQSGDNSLVVRDQIAGKKVIVENILLNQSAWIAIHEDNNGKPGIIYGARLFSSDSKNGEVILLRATQPGMKYYAMLHNENGDRVFDYKQDLPLNDENGNPIMTTFSTTR